MALAIVPEYTDALCLLHGQYVRAGTRLADGTRVNAIGADWVRLSDPSGAAQTYRVTNPMLQATQAGGRP